jgi:hypothetical protein
MLNIWCRELICVLASLLVVATAARGQAPMRAVPLLPVVAPNDPKPPPLPSFSSQTKLAKPDPGKARVHPSDASSSSKKPYTWPLHGHNAISAPYGHHTGAHAGHAHKGIDIPAPAGTPVYAARDGKVVKAGPATGFGHWVVLKHSDGQYSVYGHVSGKGLPKEGTMVRAQQQIATLGKKEGISTAPHLHFEVRQGSFAPGHSIDPAPLLSRPSSLQPSASSSARSPGGSDVAARKSSSAPAVGGVQSSVAHSTPDVSRGQWSVSKSTSPLHVPPQFSGSSSTFRQQISPLPPSGGVKIRPTR